MADLIDRAKVLDAFKQICESCGKYKQYNGVMCGACLLDDAISIVEDTPSVVDTDLSGSSFRLYRAAYDRGKQEVMTESERQTRRWIPCSERLPEQDTEVLVTRRFLGVKDPCGGWHAHLRPKTYVEIASLMGKVWVSDSDEHKIAPSKHADPVAWIPLPDPYQEEGENQ